jgi:hypothetical protein
MRYLMNLVLKYLPVILSICFANVCYSSELFIVRHVSLNVATLVPVVEPHVWLSNCNPASKELREPIFTDISKLKYVNVVEYDPLNVRIAMYAIDATYYIDAGLRIKLITQNSVFYSKIDTNSALAKQLHLVFDQCAR